MNRTTKGAALAAIFAVLCTLMLFSWLSLETAFPVFQYTTPRFLNQLIGVEALGEIAKSVSKFLWEHRGLDLLMQAFVIVATVMCCMAMLKPGREE